MITPAISQVRSEAVLPAFFVEGLTLGFGKTELSPRPDSYFLLLPEVLALKIKNLLIAIKR
jgi:hypothetical protein